MTSLHHARTNFIPDFGPNGAGELLLDITRKGG